MSWYPAGPQPVVRATLPIFQSCDARIGVSFSSKIDVLHCSGRHFPNSGSQFVRRGAADKIPTVENSMNRQIRQKREREGYGQRTVTRVRRLADAERVGESQALVAQE